MSVINTSRDSQILLDQETLVEQEGASFGTHSRMRRSPIDVLYCFLLCLILCIVFVGCGGSATRGSTPTSSIASLSVTCTPSSLQVTQTSKCAVTVSGTGSFDSSVTWSVDNGTIDQTGNYTAPASAVTATVKATSNQDATEFGMAKITVTAPAIITSVTVACVPSIIQLGQKSKSTATVNGTGTFDPSVTWSVDKGTTDQNGNYTAPVSAATATVKATSNRDATKFGTSTIAVTASALPTQPSILSLPPTAAIAGKLLQYQVRALSADVAPPVFSLSVAPSGMVIDSTTGLISWTPVASEVGDQSITIVVADALG